MRLFLLNFINDYLAIVLVTLFFLIVLSFKVKHIRYFLFTMIFLMSASLGVYGLYRLEIISENFYQYTCEFACFLMYAYQMIVSLVLHMQLKLVVNMDMVNVVINSIMVLDRILLIDLSFVMIINYFLSIVKYVIKNRFVKFISYVKDELFITQNLSKNIVVMNC